MPTPVNSAGQRSFWPTAHMRGRRWSNNDRRYGPFTYSGSDSPSLSIVLDSGHGEYSGCSLRLRAFRRTLIIELPAIIKPWRKWVDCSHYQWSTGADAGYWDEHSREYGFAYSDGFLQVFLGAQTHDSSTTQSWNKFLPWTQWHFHRESYHGLSGEVLREWITSRRRTPGFARYEEQREFRKTMPKASFLIDDYDGQRITATTHIEEREWTFGEGWFRWLRLFRRNKVHRSLAIEFDKEVGPEKGSWKGGMTGHSVEMLPGELHEQAFRRYCEQEHRSKYARFKIAFVGRATGETQ